MSDATPGGEPGRAGGTPGGSPGGGNAPAGDGTPGRSGGSAARGDGPGGGGAPGGTAGAGTAGADGSGPGLNAIDATQGTESIPPANAVARSRWLHRATGMYVGGDQVGGNKFVLLLGDRQPAPLREVDTALSDPARHAFVEPDDWDRTRDAFRDRRLVILRGEPGHGRVAAAIRLLQAPSDRRIFNLDRDIDLHRFPHWLDTDAAGDDPLPIGAGFLLCDPTGTQHLQGWILHRIATALTQRDGRMVITLDADRVLSDDEARDFAVGLGRPRPHRAILASHLRWRLTERQDGDAAALAERILADREMAEFLDTALADGAPVKVAANLAMMIDQQYDGTAVDMTGLRRQVRERVVEDFDIWFGALPDIPTRSMAIALAVLNGLPFESVTHAARRLCDLLDGPPQLVAGDTVALRPPWRDPFRATFRERRRMLRARIRQDTEFGEFGHTPIEIVEYIDRDRPRSVLHHVWHEYQFQRPLLDWLQGLATDPSEDVRAYAGTALGVLCTYAFDFVYTHTLREMTLADNPRSREVVAYAMRLSAGDERFRPLVRRVANRLHGNADQRQAQATSARIRGLALGPADPTRALDWLERLALVNDRRVASAIGDSLADLIVADEDAHGPAVLRRVVRWQDDRRRTLTGEFVFHQLADSLVTNVDMTKQDASTPDWHAWPGLLYLADHHRDIRPLLIAAWVRVLNSGLLADRVRQAVDNWAGYAESYPEVRTAFVRLMSATAAHGPRTRTILLRHAARWRAPDEVFPSHETAEAVERALKARTDDP